MVKVLYEEKNIIKTFIIESNKTILDLSIKLFLKTPINHEHSRIKIKNL